MGHGDTMFNAVCFSRQLTTFPSPVASLKSAAAMMKPGGSIYIPHVVSDTPQGFVARVLQKWMHFATASDIIALAAEAALVAVDDSPAFGEEDEKAIRTWMPRLLRLERQLVGTVSGEEDCNFRFRKKDESISEEK